MIQQVKGACLQAWQSEFNPGEGPRGGKREATPKTCPLTATQSAHPPIYTHSHTLQRLERCLSG